MNYTLFKYDIYFVSMIRDFYEPIYVYLFKFEKYFFLSFIKKKGEKYFKTFLFVL